jgi:hypothetical protein
MPPVFKNVDISIDDVSLYMRNVCQKLGEFKSSRRSLIGSYYGEQIMLATPLIQWYCDHGLLVDNITSFVRYDPIPCFRNFTEEVANARRKADIDQTGTAAGNTAKLVGNALYGKTITNKEKHVDVKYAAANKTRQFTNSPLFQHMSKINDDIYEVQLHKGTIKHDLPIQIGFWVYCLAKMRMLEFYYDFLVKFFDQSKFELSQMDTDSLYFAIAGDEIEDILKPDMRSTYFRECHLWLPSEHCDSCTEEYVTTKVAKGEWELKPCCDDRLKFDKRTPGLFKLEFQGDKILSLCSKSYICVDGEQTKKAHKGVNGRQNDLLFKHYEQVLTDSTQLAATNRGIRVWDDKNVFTYEQTKVGLTCIYIKRQVQADGVTTTPLKL